MSKENKAWWVNQQALCTRCRDWQPQRWWINTLEQLHSIDGNFGALLDVGPGVDSKAQGAYPKSEESRGIPSAVVGTRNRITLCSTVTCGLAKDARAPPTTATRENDNAK